MTENRDHSTLHPSPEKLAAYLREELDNREAHLLEKHLLDCDLCAEALEGLEESNLQTFEEDVAVLKKSIERRSKKASPFRTYGIAAAIAVLITATFIVINRQTNEILEVPDTAMESIEESEGESEIAIITDSVSENSVITEETLIAQEVKPVEESIGLGQGGSGSEYADQFSSGAESKEKKDEREQDIALLQSKSAEPEPSSMQPASPGPVSEKRTEASFEAEEISEEEISRALATRKRRKATSNNKTAPLPQLETTQLRTIYGNVYSYDDLSPLPGVTIVLKGTTTGAVTDTDGNFEITIPPGDQTLSVNYIGFIGTEIQLDDSDTIEISLDSDEIALSEVVMTGSSEDAETEEVYRQAPKPGIGRKSFRKYLEDNLRYPQAARENGIEGKVVLNVSLNEFGIIKDIEVRKGLGYGCDEEAIRLLKEGPSWEPGEVNGEPTDSEIIVRVKFEIEE